MAVKPCRECGEEVSETANTCPNCGIKCPARKLIWWLGTLAVLSIFVLCAVFTRISAPNQRPANYESASTFPVEKSPQLAEFKNGVAFKIRFDNSPNMKPTIVGYTNLPDGTQLMLDIRRRKIGYVDGVETTVQAGRFQTKNFSLTLGTFAGRCVDCEDGPPLPLPPGDYDVSISTPLPEFEPPSVQQIIGKHGEFLKGSNTERSYSSRMVKYHTVLRLGSGESADADAKALELQKQAKQQATTKQDEKIPVAQVMCKQFVKEHLNDPDSAEFDDAASFPAKFSNEIYIVDVHVRARNGFNALRAVIFECDTMPWSADKWTLLKIKQLTF
jgi:hypothetical protein